MEWRSLELVFYNVEQNRVKENETVDLRTE